jgi:hypothetical protein
MTEYLVVFRFGFGDSRDRFLRNDQDMRWRLWLDVAKGEHQSVLVNNRGGNFAGDNFFKKGFAHAEKIPESKSWRHKKNNRSLTPSVAVRDLLYQQPTFRAAILDAQTSAQKLYYLVLQDLTARTPAPGADKLLYTSP